MDGTGGGWVSSERAVTGRMVRWSGRKWREEDSIKLAHPLDLRGTSNASTAVVIARPLIIIIV